MLAAALAATVAATTAAAAPAPRPLPDVDVRAADFGPVGSAARRARAELARGLGREGVVSSDRLAGGVRRVARLDGFLTAPSAASPAQVALDYLAAHAEAFGLDEDDLAALRPTRSYQTADGVTHLAFTQTAGGIAAYDNVLLAHVARDGRLLTIGGSAIGDLAADEPAPRLTAGAALGAALADVGGEMLAPRAQTDPGPERSTQFATGDRARLTLFADGATTRLAWRVEATGAGGLGYEVVVDASDGAILARRSLTAFASAADIFKNHPGAAQGGTATPVDLAADPSWLDRSASRTKLRGNNAQAFADLNGNGNVDAGEDVPASGASDWLYPQDGSFRPLGQLCPPVGCTWDSTSPSSAAVNRAQATTQLFYLVNRFHDHLEQAPIGFTHAAGGFEFTDADGTGGGVGGDPLLAAADAAGSMNNASMQTPPDGSSPHMRIGLFGPTDAEPGIASLNAADSADVVFHEYTHGLTARSVGSGSGVGLTAAQSAALAEGWSDWYALDELADTGLRPDDAAVDGELTIGAYLIPGGFRTQGLDCPVASTATACPGRGPGQRGGYTLGDFGSIAGGPSPHADGEIWGETLWDLRTALRAALGPTAGVDAARELVTEGVRLAPDNPSFLEARDAIILADLAATGGARRALLWAVFAARGMGAGATTTSGSATTAAEAFDVPPRLVHDATAVDDDGDDVPEPGDTLAVSERLRNPNAAQTTGISGTLGTSTPGASVEDATQPWAGGQKIAAGGTGTNASPFHVDVPASANCDATVALRLAVTTDQTAEPFDVGLHVALSSKPSSDVPKVIPPGGAPVASTLTFAGDGEVSGLEILIPLLAHSWVGDLVATLRSPHGTEVTLFNRPGAGSDGAAGHDLAGIVLDDDAAMPIDSIAATSPADGYHGRFRPVEPLSRFDGERWQGSWTLTLRDAHAPEDTGTLHDWALRPSDAAPCVRRPEAIDDAYAVGGGATLTATTVLANDSEPNGAPLSAVLDAGPAYGTVALAPNGTFSYTPQAGFRGTDTFAYLARNDGQGSSAPATVRIAVGNTPPVAVGDSYATVRGATLVGASVLANDRDANGEALTAALVAAPLHGGLTLAADGTFSYVPEPGFAGRDSFAYTASDGVAASAPAVAVIDVGARAVRPSFARLEVLRARVARGRLDLRAAISGSATGRVRVELRARGVTRRLTAPIVDGRIVVRRTLTGAQRRARTGIVTIAYAGNASVRPATARLRVGRRAALLRVATVRLDGRGRMRVSGSISRRAVGVVRLRLEYERSDGAVGTVALTAPIRRGAWSLATTLPAAARAGGQLSIRYVGDARRRIGGEQCSRAVTPSG